MTALLQALLGLVLVALALPADAAESAAVTTSRTVATLVSSTDRVDPGQPVKLGLLLKLAPGWHTYWRNPGDAGVAPELSFTLPEGGAAGPLEWPAPTPQAEGPLMTYGYAGEVLLAAEVQAPAGPLRLHANWLVCKEICVPEQGDFVLDLAPGAPAASAEAPLFAAAAAALPRPSPWSARIGPDGTLTVSGDGIGPRSVRAARYIPADPGTIVDAAAQPLAVRDGSFTLMLQRGAAFTPAKGLNGVLAVTDGAGRQSALAVSAEPGGPTAAAVLPVWRVLGLAALGGLILNLMPCVFPVLAVKAAGLAGLGGAARRGAVVHALCYAGGVLVTFLAVGGVLLGLRAAGEAAGWGFQFQSPAFVAAIAWVLFAVGLNLSGVFAVAPPGTGAGQPLTMRRGSVGSFFTGLLAVLVATPCTAPFMGVAIGAALATGSPALIEAVFLAMGIGLAAPYVVLAAAPGFSRLLPRPGRWMEILRQALAFPMYAAAAWLVWVISREAGSGGVVAAGAGLVLIGFAGWALGLAEAGPERGGLGQRGRRVARSAALAAMLAALAVLSGIAVAPRQAIRQDHEAGVEPFSDAKLAALRGEGRPVFVNMTAAWCVTCLVNERVALAQPQVRQAFASRGVVILEGDWTLQDAAITRYMASLGRDGVPLYALYPPGHDAQLLPQILTEGTVLAALSGIGR